MVGMFEPEQSFIDRGEEIGGIVDGWGKHWGGGEIGVVEALH